MRRWKQSFDNKIRLIQNSWNRTLYFYENVYNYMSKRPRGGEGFFKHCTYNIAFKAKLFFSKHIICSSLLILKRTVRSSERGKSNDERNRTGSVTDTCKISNGRGMSKNQQQVTSSKVRIRCISVAKKSCIKNIENLAVLCTAERRPVGLLAKGYCGWWKL